MAHDTNRHSESTSGDSKQWTDSLDAENWRCSKKAGSRLVAPPVSGRSNKGRKATHFDCRRAHSNVLVTVAGK